MPDVPFKVAPSTAPGAVGFQIDTITRAGETAPAEVVKIAVGDPGTGVDVSAAHPMPVSDATAEASLASAVTTLAAILAALGGEATQTTLAALLAKVTADPATNTTLAAVLAKLVTSPALDSSVLAGTVSNHTDLGLILTKLQGTLDVSDRAGRLAGFVDLAAGAATGIADAATATATKYLGFSIAETTGTTAAVVRVRNSNVTGAILDTIHLSVNESRAEHYPRGRLIAAGTLYVQVVSGTVEGSVFAV